MTWPEFLGQLESMALLGTERSGPLGDSPFEAHDRVLKQTAIPEKEGRFLAAAAATLLFARAGLKAVTLPAPSKPSAFGTAPDDDRPPLGQGASDRLGAILGGHHPELLGEFLERMETHKKRLPPRLLPALFSRAMKEKSLWPRVMPVMGQRGRWLLGQNPDWNPGPARPQGATRREESEFHTGTRDERIAFLKAMRAEDPGRARALLDVSWAEEKPEDRADLLATLLVNLSMEDESFLQKALAERRREVREVAFEGLARLPGSEWSQRMGARLKGPIRVASSWFGKGALVIDPPETLAPDWQKDGIEAKSRIQGLGDKAYQLFCLVSAAPLSFWTQLVAWTPDQWFEAIGKTDWHDCVLLGLAKAAIRQNHPDWAVAILRGWAKQPRSLEFAARRDMAEDLIGFLEPSRREAFLIDWTRDKSRGDQADGLSFFAFFVNAMTHPWTLEFSATILRFVIERARDPKTQNQVIGIRWKDLGRMAHPGIHERVLPLITDLDDTWKKAVEPFLSVLEFRQRMLEEIAS